MDWVYSYHAYTICDVVFSDDNITISVRQNQRSETIPNVPYNRRCALYILGYGPVMVDREEL